MIRLIEEVKKVKKARHWLDVVANIDDAEKEAQIGHCMKVITSTGKSDGAKRAAFECMRILIDSRSGDRSRSAEEVRRLI